MNHWTIVGVGVVLGTVVAAVVGDASGLVHCEQHRIGVQLELENVARALGEERAETGVWPSRLDQVAHRFDAGAVPLDYWRRPFVYVPGESLMSLGEDGEVGGIGEDADVTLAL